MKTQLFSAFAFMGLSLVATLAQPSTMSQQPMISVSGSAEVKVVPDEIYLRVGVETRDPNLKEAEKQNDERIAKALVFLKANEIKGKDVQTDYVEVEPYYPSSGSWQSTKEQSYAVRKSIEIKLTQINKFEAI